MVKIENKIITEMDYLRMLKPRVNAKFQKLIDEYFALENIAQLKEFARKLHFNIRFDNIFIIDSEKVAFELAEYILRNS